MSCCIPMIGQPLLMVIAAFSVVGAAAAVVICAGAVAVGLLFGTRFARRSGAEVSLRESMRRSRAKLREELTPGERRFLYGYMLISPLVVPVAVLLLLFGASDMRGVGIVLLLVSLLVAAVPISPIMRARIQRRQQRADDRG
jgi:hypothetical protein